ncbi:hypothetical protein JTE90_015179 [Oedothorax gibbosus]|uniref:ZP domain-containing protein n=1 Tax=Oedothorax gibbosus TaxID=931172 RepID=A0AAV6V7F4_9ARAC|nr:hypothetical protein JTE90_015179 [Oedothorax gibbosus]
MVSSVKGVYCCNRPLELKRIMIECDDDKTSLQNFTHDRYIPGTGSPYHFPFAIHVPLVFQSCNVFAAGGNKYPFVRQIVPNEGSVATFRGRQVRDTNDSRDPTDEKCSTKLLAFFAECSCPPPTKCSFFCLNFFGFYAKRR